MRRRRRRLDDLEARIAALEALAPTVSYDMPARYEVDMDPPTPVAEFGDYTASFDDDDDEGCQPGVYL